METARFLIEVTEDRNGKQEIVSSVSFTPQRIYDCSDLKSQLWDAVLDGTDDADYKNRPMAFYAAKFTLTCTVSAPEKGKEEGEYLSQSFSGELDTFLLLFVLYICGAEGLCAATLYCLDPELKQEAEKVMDFKSKHESSSKVKVTFRIHAFPPCRSTHEYDWPKFPSGTLEMKSDLELEMIQEMSTIRRKELWFEKIRNPDISEKWKSETLEGGLTFEQISFIFQELNYHAAIRDPTKVSDIDGIWYSDILVEESLKQELISGVSLLENFRNKSLTNSQKQVNTNYEIQELVDPSEYPIIYGRTHMLDEGIPRENAVEYLGKKEQVIDLTEQFKKSTDYSTSTKYCWLPAGFRVKKDGTIRINSYINNLHPIRHEQLYDTLEKIFEKFVPLFENVLNDLLFRLGKKSQRVYIDPDEIQNVLKYRDAPDREDYDTDSDTEYNEVCEQWLTNHPTVVLNIPKQFSPPDPIPISKKISLPGTMLKIIVKMSSIMLPPGSSGYPEEVWHIDGMRNENIVAVGVFNFDSQNISESEISFRAAVAQPLPMMQNIFKSRLGDKLVQDLGTAATPEGRCLVFPNEYQHAVQHFGLKDASKPGHRKILSFLLVVPGNFVPNSRVVPPQQFNWFAEEILKIPRFDSLPPEITEKILQNVEWLLTSAEAEAVRQDLLEEREEFNLLHTKKRFEKIFRYY